MSMKLSSFPAIAHVEPFLRRLRWYVGVGRERHTHVAQARRQVADRFLKQQRAAIEKRDVGGHVLDLRELVRGHEDGHVARLTLQAFHQFIPHERIETAEGFIQHQEFRPERQGAGERHFESHSVGQILDPARRWQAELTEDVSLQGSVPARIERPQVVEIGRHPHASGHVLVFRHVPDLRQFGGRKRARRDAQHRGVTERRLQDVHEHFDGRGLAGAVGADEGKHAALGHAEAQALQGIDAPEPLPEVVGVHDHLRPAVHAQRVLQGPQLPDSRPDVAARQEKAEREDGEHRQVDHRRHARRSRKIRPDCSTDEAAHGGDDARGESKPDRDERSLGAGDGEVDHFRHGLARHFS